MWPNGLTLCRLLAPALECGFLSSAQPLLDKSCEKLMKLFCSVPLSFSRSVYLTADGWAGWMGRMTPDLGSAVLGGSGLEEARGAGGRLSVMLGSEPAETGLMVRYGPLYLRWMLETYV